MPADPIATVVKLLSRLPGIGERTAQRLAMHLLEQDRALADALGDALGRLHDEVGWCARCGNLALRPAEGEPVCTVCADPGRETGVLCIVARVQDLVAIERTGSFRGRYHVLHGLLSPLDGRGPESLPLDALARRLVEDVVREVIVATPPSVEGEATALYLAQTLRASRDAGLTLTRIASGVPHGGDLELTDRITLERAFEGRRSL